MPGSPLKKNYVHEIKSTSSYTDQLISLMPTTQRVRKNKSCSIQILNGCIREKIFPFSHQSRQASHNDYFEFLLLQNGIFNISKVHKSSIKLSQVMKNIPKQYIPIEERLIKSLFLFPTQTIVQCQYNMENKFHKYFFSYFYRQMILYCPGEFLIVNNFVNGKLDKEQFNFNLKDLILVKTVFSKDKIISVKDYSLADEVEYFGQDEPLHSNLKVKLQKYFIDKEFCKMIYRLTQGFFQWLEPIENGSDASSYFGRLSQHQNLPDGIGLLINRKLHPTKAKSVSQKSSIKNSNQVIGLEFFFGIFRSGLLDVLGQIWFRDRSSYFGEFDNGQVCGIGQYFSFKAGRKKQVLDPLQSFEFKNGAQSIRRQQFFKWIQEGYFNGKKDISNKPIIDFIQNQYQKLRKIYAIPKPKEELSPELEEVRNTKSSELMKNSQQIDDFGEEFNHPSFSNSRGRKSPKMADRKFDKNEDMKDIFQKIKVSNPKKQAPNTKIDRRIPQFDRTKTVPHQKHAQQITTRSDDNAYNFLEKRTFSKNDNKKERQIIRATIKHSQKTSNEYDQSFREVGGWQEERFQTHNMMDSGVDDADSSYMNKKELIRQAKYHNESDYIQKQYAFENPKGFKVPEYFIVENQRAHMKLDPNSIKANVIPQGKVKKNVYSSPPRVKKETFLSPNQKENELSLKKYQHVLSTHKSKKIFYNPTSNK